jgi:hypothetical protein
LQKILSKDGEASRLERLMSRRRHNVSTVREHIASQAIKNRYNFVLQIRSNDHSPSMFQGTEARGLQFLNFRIQPIPWLLDFDVGDHEGLRHLFGVIQVFTGLTRIDLSRHAKLWLSSQSA